MKLRVYNVEVALGSGPKAFYRAVLGRLAADRSQVRNIELVQRSIDARKKTPRWNMTADVEIAPKHVALFEQRRSTLRDVANTPLTPPLEFASGAGELRGRVVVVGSGPGGLFAAYVLAKHGYRPLVIERGAPALERLKQIGRFNSGNASLDPDANALFGEGGAGTFSDGKLYTRKNKDEHLTNVLKVLVEHGAPEDILIDAAPHLGTDKLAPVVMNMRRAVEKLGGEVRFFTQLTGLEVEGGQLKAVNVTTKVHGGSPQRERIECGACVLAIGHSARDTYQMLKDSGIQMEAKPFQFGVRIEHPQSFIDEMQFGRFAGHPELGHAEYFITCSKRPDLGEIHSFCMCPGGMIVPSVDTEGELCTNGMSFSLRNHKFANSGLVTTMTPEDYKAGNDPLAGVAFQRHWEQAAFKAGGGDFVCPAQPAADFLSRLNARRDLPGSYPRGRRYFQLEQALPAKLSKALAYALVRFDETMPGFAGGDGILHAVESRGSGPVRISRHPESRESPSAQGLYPVGEGAGFAGGIVSAALDGIHTAAAIIAQFASR